MQKVTVVNNNEKKKTMLIKPGNGTGEWEDKRANKNQLRYIMKLMLLNCKVNIKGM